MKKYIKKNILPRICITFTVTFLSAALLHIILELVAFIQDQSLSISRTSLVIVEFFSILCLDAAIDILLEKKNIRNKKFFPIVEPLIKYCEFLAIVYLFCWQSHSTKEFFGIAIMMTIYYVNLFLNTRQKCKIEASEINRLIKQRGVSL